MCLGSIGRITRRWDAGGIPMAMIHSGGREDAANLLYVPEACVGDDVLVQFGFVLERLDAERANDARTLRAQLGTDDR